MYNFIIFLFLLLVLTPSDAHAYLDPGSGSMIVSVVIAMITILIYMTKSFIYGKMKSLGKKSNLPDIKRDYNVVVYSEGGQYWNVFHPILRELDARGISTMFFTSREDDPGLQQEFTHIEKKYIGEGHNAYFILNKLNAKLLLMTTPGLGVLQIKRSKGVKHYCHITHSTGTCSSYKAFSLDYFDSVLVGGTADNSIIAELEDKRKSQKKKVEMIGSTYLDELRVKLKTGGYGYTMFTEKKTTVLVSPTWGNHGLLSKYGHKLLKTLSDNGTFNIIVRPHPQSFNSEKNLMDELMKSFPNSDTLKWDTEKDGLNAMFHSDIMISDFSGIIFDYLFLFERPVLTFKSQFEKRGREAMDLRDDAFDIKLLDRIGRTLNESDIPEIPSIIQSSMSSKQALNDVIKEAQDALARHSGEAGKRAADFIQSEIQSN